MVDRIIWLPAAQRNLNNVYKFISKKSVQAAIKTHNKLLDAVEPLLNFPQMAPIEPLLEDRDKIYRALVVDKYKIIYYFEKKYHLYRCCLGLPPKYKTTLETI